MNFQAGSVVEFQSFAPVTKEHLKAYSDASGDFNKIHLDEEVAKNAGLPGIIAHGMFIAALIAERARKFIESDSALKGFQMAHFQTRFKAMTLLGDEPSVGGIVKQAEPNLIVLELQAKNQRGEITTTGIATWKSSA